MKKRRELSDKIRQDALLIEELAKTVEDNKKKKKQIERLYGGRRRRWRWRRGLKRESGWVANGYDDSY